MAVGGGAQTVLVQLREEVAVYLAPDVSESKSKRVAYTAIIRLHCVFILINTLLISINFLRLT